MQAGNLLVHPEYKRQWLAVKDLRDVYYQFNQATEWYSQYNLQEDYRARRSWLEYLHALNLQQFDADICRHMCDSHKRNPELSPSALQHCKSNRISFCYKGMKLAFKSDRVEHPPYIVISNRQRFAKVKDLLVTLFG
jgi:hypothetical protein